MFLVSKQAVKRKQSLGQRRKLLTVFTRYFEKYKLNTYQEDTSTLYKDVSLIPESVRQNCQELTGRVA